MQSLFIFRQDDAAHITAVDPYVLSRECKSVNSDFVFGNTVCFQFGSVSLIQYLPNSGFGSGCQVLFFSGIAYFKFKNDTVVFPIERFQQNVVSSESAFPVRS